MKKIIYLLNIFFILNCSTMNNNNTNPDFTFSSTFYNEKNIKRSEIFYDSKTGVFRNERPEEVIIKLDNNDKQEVYNLQRSLNLKGNYCWFDLENNNSSETSFIIHNKSFKKIKCDSTKQEEISKHLIFYSKILRLLKSKEEYKKAFPEESEKY